MYQRMAIDHPVDLKSSNIAKILEDWLASVYSSTRDSYGDGTRGGHRADA